MTIAHDLALKNPSVNSFPSPSLLTPARTAAQAGCCGTAAGRSSGKVGSLYVRIAARGNRSSAEAVNYHACSSGLRCAHARRHAGTGAVVEIS